MLKKLQTLAFGAMATAMAAPVVAAEVNIYSYRQPELVQPLFNEFTKDTGIAVNVVFLKKGLIEKLQAEGRRSPADLVLTVDISRLQNIVDAGVTQPVKSAVLETNIPAEYRDADGQWFGLTARARVVYASRERVADGEVTTYEDLATDKWKGRICTRSGTNSYNLALSSAMIVHHGEAYTRDWLLGVKANLARRPQGNDRAQVKAIFAGECDIAIGNNYYMKKMLSKPEQRPWADAVRIVFPVFEGGGTHMNLAGIALTRAAPHKADAIRLMEWLSDTKAQEIYAEQNGEYPLKPGTKPSELVASWGEFKRDTIPLGEVAKLRPVSLRLVEEVNFDE
jgi:iron(III) transport system substrate-binding protein